jgi:hypothetical protein
MGSDKLSVEAIGKDRLPGNTDPVTAAVGALVLTVELQTRGMDEAQRREPAVSRSPKRRAKRAPPVARLGASRSS